MEKFLTHRPIYHYAFIAEVLCCRIQQRNMVDKRRSRKKRRTEVSSSEEQTSSESEVEQQLEQMSTDAVANDAEEITITAENIPSIDNLNLHNKNKQSATTADIVKTKLALQQIVDAASTINTDSTVSGTIPADEWLTMMLGEYGDDIDALRTKAADFKGESIALLADLLRTSANVFAQQ